MDFDIDDEEPSTSMEPGSRKTQQKGATSVKYTEQMMLSAMIYDVCTFLKKFNELDNWSFREFGEIFLAREFSTIFLGRLSTTELVEFSEVLLSYAISFAFSANDINEMPKFILNPDVADMNKINVTVKERPLKERIFGIYLTYCLYFTQPQTHIANIKLTVRQMKNLRMFCQNELLSNQCTEALFCMNRLVDQHAFMIVPFEREFNPVLGRNVNVMDINADNIDVLDSNESEFLPALKCMEKDITLMRSDVIHKRYMAEKEKVNFDQKLVTDSLLAKICDIVSKTERDLGLQ